MAARGAKRVQNHSNSLQIGKNLQLRQRANDIYRCNKHRHYYMREYQAVHLNCQPRIYLNLSCSYNKEAYPASCFSVKSRVGEEQQYKADTYPHSVTP